MRLLRVVFVYFMEEDRVMRVKYKNKIRVCKKASHDEGSPRIVLDVDGDFYYVWFVDSEQADELFDRLLIEGWLNLNAESIKVDILYGR